ncbi:MAG: type II toxin-antitoxin system VapB family antitoxin [Terriglobia bacterium]
MALNIKSAETEKLARELAKLTGQTMTGAITEAVRKRLEQVKNQRGWELADRLVEIGKLAPHTCESPISLSTTKDCSATRRGCHDEH